MNKGLDALLLMSTGLINKEEWKKCYYTIQKELKALEIIKKILIMDDDKQRIDVKNCVEMSDDEYELLKEILL